MAKEDFKRKLTAVLSADVAGYSRLMAEDEAATVKTIAIYREVMASLIKQHRGRVVDSPGDNVLAEFASVVDAVQCAVSVQKELQARNAELPENRRMEFRIGINLGDVIEEEDRIYGDGVNIAARLEALADPGGICVSKTAFDQIETKLPLGYEYLGEQPVKNIPKPVGAYRVLMEPRVTVAEEIEKGKAMPVWRRKAIVAGGVALIVLVIAALIWNYYFRPPPMEVASVERMAYPLPEKPSVAVLPFVNVSKAPEQEYLSDGITENIITALSKTPKMFVIASNSVFTYKGKPVKVQQVAEEMGVRYVLEGSVQRVGDRLRINAQLIDAIGGHHLWAERYDRDLKDIFALQDEITMKILTAMEIKLTEGQAARAHAKGTNNLEAYLKNLQARELIRKLNKEDNDLARGLLKEAIALDPEYATAHVGLSFTHLWDVQFGWSKSPKKSFKQAAKLSGKALALDDSLDLAHALAGIIYLHRRMFEKAISEGKKGIALGPNNTTNMAMLALIYGFIGKPEESIKLLEKAIRLNPIPPAYYLAALADAYRSAGRYEDAIRMYKKVLKQKPNFGLVPFYLSAVYILAGHEEEARAAIEELLKKNPKMCIETVKASFKRRPYKSEKVYAHVIEALRKAGLPETPPLPLPDKSSIAVLPFINMSGDPEQEYFSDGITEEIITALSKTPKLFVIARNSTFTYKGKPVKVQQVGRELGVKYVLEGSVRKAEDKVRITAQLVDAQTGHHLWAERYDAELKDIFTLQDEITMKILTSLQVKLTVGEQAQIWAKGTNNLDAYSKLLKARDYLVRGNRDDNVMARQLAQETIALDPDFPGGYTILAATHLQDILYGATKSPGKSIEKASELVEKALALDDSFFYAHNIVGRIYLIKRQHEKAIAQYERALELNPNVADAYALFGVALMYADRPEEAIELFKKAIRFNPMPPSYYLFELANAYRMVGRYDDSIATYKKVLDRTPNHLTVHAGLTATYSVAGRLDDARAQAAEVLRVQPKFSAEGFVKKMPYKNKAETERLIDALLKAGLR